MKTFGMTAVLLGLAVCINAQPVSPDTLYRHKVLYDPSGRILGWHQPEIPGAVYHRVVTLASEFLLHVPLEPRTGLPMHLVTCCFEDPYIKPDKAFEARKWMHNPACFFAGCVQSLAVQYRPYCGDDRYVDLVREMLDYQLAHGMTPSGFVWPNVPYASSDPFEPEYRGSVLWEKRGDGLYGIEPDKVGELGHAFLQFYKITGEEKYLQAAIHCADALAKNVQEPTAWYESGGGEHEDIVIDRSPWPFRVDAQTGAVIDPYCSNVLEPVKLLNELLRLDGRIALSTEQAAAFRRAKGIAWGWLFSRNGPLRTFIWNGFFEDVVSDPTLSNRVQITPVELAKYLARHSEEAIGAGVDIHVPALLYYALSAFKADGIDAMKEQLWCYNSMGSHTARFGAACALWFEYSGEERFRDMAFRYLNMASYMTHDDGVVSTGLDYTGGVWFSDGYSDYIRHFLDAMAAVPAWAPANENHFLRSSSVIQAIHYRPEAITYRTFDPAATERFRLTQKPAGIIAGTRAIQENTDLSSEGWTWEPCPAGGGILNIHHQRDASVTIQMDKGGI
ncbi:MAG: hypothetical protein LBP98_08095 [Tannerella sp.]|nr:hypothetical protein [Tannerella sp.]